MHDDPGKLRHAISTRHRAPANLLELKSEVSGRRHAPRISEPKLAPSGYTLRLAFAGVPPKVLCPQRRFWKMSFVSGCEPQVLAR